MKTAKPPSGVGEGFKRIAEQNCQDAARYLWSERVTMIAGIGFIVAFMVVALFPLLNLIHGTWLGFPHYILGVVLIPSPFLLTLIVSAWLHRRIARKYGL
jgi:uncharacterized membrane protein